MTDQESTIISELSSIVNSAQKIAEVEPILGDSLLFFVGQTMRVYESIAKGEEFNLRDIVQFIGRIKCRSEAELLRVAYPGTSTENLGDPISTVIQSDDADLSAYKKAEERLLKSFKAAVESG